MGYAPVMITGNEDMLRSFGRVAKATLMRTLMNGANVIVFWVNHDMLTISV